MDVQRQVGSLEEDEDADLRAYRNQAAGFFSEAFHDSKHLHAFCPYFEKENSSHSRETLASSLPHHISIATIRAWLRACDTWHNPHCQYVGGPRTGGRPLWLIDVHELCIVPAEEH